VARFALPRRASFWLRVTATSTGELPTPVWSAGGRPALPLVHLLAALEHAAADAQVDGVLLRLDGATPGLATALALRRALRQVVQAGKPVVAWGERLTAPELVVASGANHVHVPEAGSVGLVGLRLETWFVKGLLDRLGVAPDVVRIGSFKSAGETLTRDAMSPEQREQLEALLEDRFDALVTALAEGRDMRPERVRELVDQGPHGARAAAEAGLVDGCLHADEVEPTLEKLAPPQRAGRLRVLDAAVYHGLRVTTAGARLLAGPSARIAYLVANGSIHGGAGLRGVASDRYRELLARLADDEEVQGVVLRVDSPGGDGVASDLIWRAVQRLRREKPVVASFGEVAASGGYYVAAGADRILAEPATVTGSIGVVGGKLDLSGLYDRLGIHKEGVERGARAGLTSETRGFTSDERRVVRTEMESVYALFLERVASGRGLAREVVERVAQGRVWSGAQALEHGLVDRLGGPLEALAEVRQLAGLQAGEPAPVEVLPHLPRFPGLRFLLGPGVRASGLP
jgi:protease-4